MISRNTNPEIKNLLDEKTRIQARCKNAEGPERGSLQKEINKINGKIKALKKAPPPMLSGNSAIYQSRGANAFASSF